MCSYHRTTRTQADETIKPTLLPTSADPEKTSQDNKTMLEATPDVFEYQGLVWARYKLLSRFKQGCTTRRGDGTVSRKAQGLI